MRKRTSNCNIANQHRRAIWFQKKYKNPLHRSKHETDEGKGK